MRLAAGVALLGTCLSIGNVQAQTGSGGSGADKTAAPAPASESKPKAVGTRNTDALTENTAEGRGPAPQLGRNEGREGREADSAEAAPAPPSAPVPAERAIATVPLVAAAPPVAIGQPTADQLARIQIGTAEKEVVAALGEPAACVIIPDDGHLLKNCQYWTKGSPVGTIRLDNGVVVKVEPKH